MLKGSLHCQCNLKPVTMRGVKSFAMLLCVRPRFSAVGPLLTLELHYRLPPQKARKLVSSSFDHPRDPSLESESTLKARSMKVGALSRCQGRAIYLMIFLSDVQPEPLLNPKKKVFETIQPVCPFSMLASRPWNVLTRISLGSCYTGYTGSRLR